jgi:hypothetical protein
MKQCLCNKAEEGTCNELWCIHNRPHSVREVADYLGDQDYDYYIRIDHPIGEDIHSSWMYMVWCTQKRSTHYLTCPYHLEKVHCVVAKGIKKKDIPSWGKQLYDNCIYYDEETGECCNGVDEGTDCLGLHNRKCEAFENNEYNFGYIELIANAPVSGDEFIEVSSNGRIFGSEPKKRGSNPCTSANKK